MSVTEVHNGTAVEANHIYVIPPNRSMSITNGVLTLLERRKTAGKFMPIDAFFYALAEDVGSMAIGVVLSGTDGDGALGLKAIKVAGGLAFAQDEESSQFAGMPRSAAETGLLDFILPPRAIAAELARIARHPYLRSATVQEDLPGSEETRLAVVALLYSATGVDFGQYKRPSFNRRLQRRMVLHQIASPQDYVRYLESHSEELQALYRDVLISVTAFFRDPEVFEMIQSVFLPAIITAEQSRTLPIRIWVAGCATGEEAYSLAICVLEFLEEHALRLPVQIFGTDISDEAIGLARAAYYHSTQIEGVSPERLQRFFVPSDGGYQVAKHVRELCIFARHDLLMDPPFSQMDLVSCRNVLIYFSASAQKRVLTTFHYSLKQTGYLLLGTSETPGSAIDLFNQTEAKTKLYMRKLVPARLPLEFAMGGTASGLTVRRNSDNDVANDLDLQKQADRIVLSRYAPAGVVVNMDGEVLHFRGQTGSYLEPGPGRASLNLLKMVHPGLRAELRSALQRAKKQSVSQFKEDIPLLDPERERRVRIDVAPFKPATGETYFLVLFTETLLPTASIETLGGARRRSIEQQRVLELQQELIAKEEYLRTAIEESETVNQDLRVANEEVLSSNEELQSTNEELQTAKEEIQATNEELQTINEELQRRNYELDQLGSDLQNLLSSTQIPIVMLDGALCIRRFTPLAGRLLNLIPTDIGRPVGDINLQLSVSDLPKLIQEVVGTLETHTQEVQDRDGRWYEMRIRPYRTLDDKIEGAAVVLVDIDESKRVAEQIKAARDYAQSIVETVRVPLLVIDADLRTVTANQAFYAFFQTTPTETEGQLFFGLSGAQWNLPPLRALLENLLPNNTQLLDYKVAQEFRKIGHKTIRLNARELIGTERGRMILLALEDITQIKLTEESQRIALQKEYELNELKSRLIAMASHEFRTPLSTIMLSTQLLASTDSKQSAEKRLTHQQRIEKAIVQITNLLDGILNVGRAETDQLEIHRVPLDLTSFCHQLIEEMQSTTAHQLVFISDAQECSASFDAHILKQILTNLLTNAIKYSASDSAVRLELACQDTQIIFKIIDQGIGITPQDQENVFEPFYRGNNIGTVSGSGLGLAIVKRLVEMLRGQIALESSHDQGTTFTITLPFEVPTDG